MSGPHGLSPLEADVPNLPGRKNCRDAPTQCHEKLTCYSSVGT